MLEILAAGFWLDVVFGACSMNKKIPRSKNLHVTMVVLLKLRSAPCAPETGVRQVLPTNTQYPHAGNDLVCPCYLNKKAKKLKKSEGP